MHTSYQSITCRACGNSHQSPVVCPYCQEVTPHYAVLKGGAK
jgi:rubrerythrin